MKSRILVSMLVIALAAALVGGATMSIFTAQGETDEKTYAAGTVLLDVTEQEILETGTTMNIGNMAPGDTIEGEFKVTNIGTLPLWFEVTEETKKVEGSENNYLFGGSFPAEVTIVDYDNELDPGEETTIGFSVHLPLEAGNWYQNAEGILLFNVYAEQSDHNPYEGGNGEEDDEVVNFEVENFEIRDYIIRDDRVVFDILNAINADGRLITAEKQVTVTLQTRHTSFGSWQDRSGSTTVNLTNGAADGVEIVVNNLRSQIRNIVVTIDGASVPVNL